MKKTTKYLPLITVLFSINLSFISFANAESFENTALGKEVIKLGLKFLDNPGDFFFNIHNNSEDFSPVLTDRHGSIRFNLFPALLPLSWSNINIKAKIFNEQRDNFMPQIDLIGQYGNILALNFISGDVEPSFTDYSIGTVISRSVTDETRLFGGVKYSNVSMNVVLSSSSIIELGEFRVSELNFKVADTFLFMGIAHQKDLNNPKRLVSQLGYGFKYKKIVSRIMIQRRHLDYGMDIYPEGLFVIHPFVAYHWNF